jgi:hypothetical protein
VALFDEDEDEDDDFWLDESDEFVPESLDTWSDISGKGDSTESDTSYDINATNEVFRAFWAVALMVKVGLLATSLGLMFIVFRNQLRFGGGLFAIGALALLVGYRRYRNYQNG